MATITGANGADLLTGTEDADEIFTLDGSDVVEGRGGNDRLDLSQLDPNVNAAGDQAFVVVGALTGVAGQLLVAASGGLTFVRGDTNGDGIGDFEFEVLAGDGVLVPPSDFIL